MTDAKKAAKEFAKINAFRPLERMYDCKETFLAGAAWQAEQDKAEIARLRGYLTKITALRNNIAADIARIALAEKKGDGE